MKFSCIICKGQDYTKIANKTRDSNINVVKCLNCSHVQLFPLPTDLEEKKFYDKDKQTRLLHKRTTVMKLRKISEFDTKRRVNAIGSYFNAGEPLSLLDIGTGYGFFLEELRKLGFNPVGLEISKDRLRIAKKITSSPIWNFEIKGSNKTGKNFNIVTMFHVLEHIKDPIKLCGNLKTYLKEDGVLIIEVPNRNNYLLRLSKQYRDFFWQRAHLSYFTPEVIKNTLKKSGYNRIRISGVQRYGIKNALNWLVFGKPQLKDPSYNSKNNPYKNYLEKNLNCDTLWVKAKV